jgi:hypothetical protein
MNKPVLEIKKKPLLASAAVFCAVVSLPMARIFSNLFAPKEDLLGYGALGVALIVLIFWLFIGFVLGFSALFRGEHPRTLPVIAIFLNGAALIWVVAKLPG